MSWLASIGLAALCALAGSVCGGAIASLCVGWYRVSSFEGRSGYFVVGWALVGGAAAFAIGLVAARVAAAGGDGSAASDAASAAANAAAGATSAFPRAAALALGAVGSVAVVVLGLCWLMADHAPTLDGAPVELEVEVRVAAQLALPELDTSPATASVHVPGGRMQPFSVLAVEGDTDAAGRRVLRGTVPLATSAAGAQLWVRLGGTNDVFFDLPLRRRFEASDERWSDFAPALRTNVGTPAHFEARRRLRAEPDESLAHVPDPRAERAASFAALAPDAPLASWLPYLFESPEDARTHIVLAHVEAQQLELAMLIRSDDARLRDYALQATAYPRVLAPEVVEAVAAEGRLVAERLREFGALAADDPRRAEVLGEAAARFDVWKSVWWGLCERVPLDGRPLLEEIGRLAAEHPDARPLVDMATDARAIAAALRVEGAPVVSVAPVEPHTPPAAAAAPAAATEEP
jgi:hypothetical protein